MGMERNRKILYGNWKMNQNLEDIENFFQEIPKGVSEVSVLQGIAPQFPHLAKVGEKARALGIRVGAQNCSHQQKGAFTGEVSPLALSDMGIDFVLVGHSERRQIFGETDEMLNQKATQALGQGLQVVFCLGETLEEREASRTEEVLTRQLQEGLKDISTALGDMMAGERNLILAYEPVWAIGTGKVATTEQIVEAHAHIRNVAQKLGLQKETAILYGGSVKPANAAEILEQKEVDGALVGGASLKPKDFAKLCQIADTAG